MRQLSVERAGVDGVEAELVEQSRDRRLGVGIVAGNDQRAAVLSCPRAARPS